jgi:hypothetical protein
MSVDLTAQQRKVLREVRDYKFADAHAHAEVFTADGVQLKRLKALFKTEKTDAIKPIYDSVVEQKLLNIKGVVVSLDEKFDPQPPAPPAPPPPSAVPKIRDSTAGKAPKKANRLADILAKLRAKS